MVRSRLASLLVLMLVMPCCSAASPAEDEQTARAVVERYRQAWLANDAQAVLATFRSDGILLAPGHPAPIVGRQQIHSYWWPAGGAATEITAFEMTIDRVDVASDLAFVSGHDRVEWVTREPGGAHRASSRSRFLTVLRREDGSWAIQAHSWFAL